jgi:thiol-disulfide isomerase/thioredoxin
MALITRRGLAAIAGANLAMLPMARKPSAQVILQPKPEAAPQLEGMDALVMLDQPLTLAPGSFTDADGKPVSLADFAGKGVVLNMWATWCAPCVAEMPALDTLAAKLGDSAIVVLPVSSDRGGAKVVQRFYAAHNIAHLGLWLDPHGEAAQGWGARGLPTTLIIDRQGRARAKLEGGAEWASDAALAAIRKLTA